MTAKQTFRRISFLVLATAIIAPSLWAQRSAKAKAKAPRSLRSKSLPQVNIVPMFREAKATFEEGNYSRASVLFHRILKINPNHQPSMLLYGRTSYKLKRYNEAIYLFSRIPPKVMDSESSYEFGQSLFNKQQYAHALAQFKMVPEKHALGDLARYYGGLSAAKLKDYAEAEELMKAALVLPEREGKARSVYLMHIGKMRELQQKQALASERAQERERMKLELQLAERAMEIENLAIKSKGRSETEAQIQEAPYQHRGFHQVIKAANSGAVFKSQSVDYSGLREERAELRQFFLEVLGGTTIPFGRSKEGDRNVIGLQLAGLGMDETRDGREFRSFIESELPDVVRILSPLPERRAQSVGQLDTSLWLEMPFDYGIWLSVAGNFFIRAPRFERGERYGSQSGSLQLGQRLGELSYAGRLVYQQIFDPASDVMHDIIESTAGVMYQPHFDTFLSAEFSYRNFEYYGDYRQSLDGPSNIYRLHATAMQRLPLGFFVEANAFADYQTDFLAHQVINHPLPVAANGFVYSGRAMLGISPWRWLTASAYVMAQRAQWQSFDPESQEDFDRKVYNFLEESGAIISVNLFF